ncbi:MAG: aminotransferase class I/II-fold pyridoxal phosphate-dependent enzyme [Coraliomargaritaceae bacterium]
MQTFLITANDTDVGKTYVTGILAEYFADLGKEVQIVKAIDCGGSNDAESAALAAGSRKNISAYTLLDFPKPLAPLASGNHSGEQPVLPQLLEGIEALPPCEVRLIETAGGVAVPIDLDGSDWYSFAEAIQPQCTIAIIDNRLGAINQGRLVEHYLKDLPHCFVLNETNPTEDAVKISNAEGYTAAGMARLAHVANKAEQLADLNEKWLAPPAQAEPAEELKTESNPWIEGLMQRKKTDRLRTLPNPELPVNCLNLADNDYLDLRKHPKLIDAGQAAIKRWGTSSSASPLITGYTQAHADLEATIGKWYGGATTLLWNSGYTANQSILQCFIQSSDLVLADRLIHNSLISGILRSGARLIRFRHNDNKHLESLLKLHRHRTIHLVTESVYSMDGDYPDLSFIGALKKKYNFTWFLDEAHAVGWYGDTGAGLAEEQAVLDQVDILTGTLGKSLASAGAYTIFRHQWMRDVCINEAGEFIYSTYLPPASAAIAEAAIKIVNEQATERKYWRESARQFRETLRANGWDVIGEDSPIVPIICGQSSAAIALSHKCFKQGLKLAAIRPPTVPKGAARLRLSLKSTLTASDYEQILSTLGKPQDNHD